MRRRDLAGAERTYAGLARENADAALNNLLPTLHDETDVHRVVLVWRAWAMIDLIGKEQAHTLLRQSVHFCIDAEKHGSDQTLRTLVPKLLDQHKLADWKPGKRTADDAWVEGLSKTIFEGTPRTGG